MVRSKRGVISVISVIKVALSETLAIRGACSSLEHVLLPDEHY